jgi:predicted TIM-barrel fold metal-dependent hydrolase
MKPVIDVHEHIFRARDIPVKGYLYSRPYEGFLGALVRFFRLPGLLACCIRRRRRTAEFGPMCRLLIRLAGVMTREDYTTWAGILSQPDVDIVAAMMQDTFAHDRIHLFVPLMIDYEYWFQNTVDIPLAAQIDEVYRHVVLRSRGRVHPFAPFDPVRELAFEHGLPSPDGRKEHDGSLALVKEAVDNKGFLGVKLYNSLGYRPWDNAAVDDKRSALFRRIGMPLYAGITGVQIDHAMEKLYRWCVQEQVPITAHCVSDGIESYPGASYDFCSPQYWRNVLRRHPTLHLNLAHFGWSEAERYTGRGTGGMPPWVKQVCDLLRDFPFVFTDVAHHAAFTPRAADYLRDYTEILGSYRDVVPKRLLFGIDWHVVSRLKGYERFKSAYVDLLRGNGLFSRAETADFLGGNALHFLGLLKRAAPPAAGWNGNRIRLARFYRRNGITPPRWFTATGP